MNHLTDEIKNRLSFSFNNVVSFKAYLPHPKAKGNVVHMFETLESVCRVVMIKSKGEYIRTVDIFDRVTETTETYTF